MRKYIIDGIFEGSLKQFQDRFFSNADDSSIKTWCNENGYKLEIEDPNNIIVVNKPDGIGKPIAIFTRKGYNEFKKKFPDEHMLETEFLEIDTYGSHTLIPMGKNIYLVYMSKYGNGYKFKHIHNLTITVQNARRANEQKMSDQFGEMGTVHVYVWGSSAQDAIEIAENRVAL